MKKINEIEIIDKIKEYDSIIILRHQNPDPDAFGSQLSLKKIINLNFPDKKVFVAGTNPKNDIFDYKDVLDEDTYKKSLILILDTANTERIDGKNYKLGKEIIKIDHHPDKDIYGDEGYIDNDSSSTSEIIGKIMLDNSLKYDSEISKLIYLGIYGDTGRFMFNTNPFTYELVSKLIQKAGSFDKLNQKMESISKNQALFAAKLLKSSKIEDGVAWAIIKSKDFEEAGITEDQTNFVTNIFAPIEEVDVWAVFLENDNKSYRVRLRSKGPVINDVAAKYHGGGHPLASGAVANDEIEIKEIVKDLKIKEKENKK